MKYHKAIPQPASDILVKLAMNGLPPVKLPDGQPVKGKWGGLDALPLLKQISIESKNLTIGFGLSTSNLEFDDPDLPHKELVDRLRQGDLNGEILTLEFPDDTTIEVEKTYLKNIEPKGEYKEKFRLIQTDFCLQGAPWIIATNGKPRIWAGQLAPLC
jgi:hypothetical protein